MVFPLAASCDAIVLSVLTTVSVDEDSLLLMTSSMVFPVGMSFESITLVSSPEAFWMEPPVSVPAMMIEPDAFTSADSAIFTVDSFET